MTAGPPTERPKVFEIYLARQFSGLELAAITHTLTQANQVVGAEQFKWRFVAEEPGLVKGGQGMMVRAEPAIENYALSDAMIVIGGTGISGAKWLKRARLMQRKRRMVVLLSDAATAYIKSTKTPTGHVTTHWQDASLLAEAGYHPTLTARIAENSDGIITAAGGGATSEIVIGLISPALSSDQIADLANRLLLPAIRPSDAEQPSEISGNTALFDLRIAQAVNLMERTLSDPLPMPELTDRLNLSSRHLERLFRSVFNDTPARFYKRLRAKKARAMIEETRMPVVDVAVATGFKSTDTLAKALKEEYGLTPSKMRARRSVKLMKF